MKEGENTGPLYRLMVPVHETFRSRYCEEYDSCEAAIAQLLRSHCISIAQALHSNYK